MQGVARTESSGAGAHGDVKIPLRPAVWVIVQLVAMLERVARRGRPVRPVIHPVVVVVVCSGRVGLERRACSSDRFQTAKTERVFVEKPVDGG